MALRTKIRVAQVTGSFGTGTGQINDQIAGVATGSINSSDLSSVLSHLAASIKRIHGASSFSEGTAGTFSQSITVNGSLTSTTGLSGSLTKLADGTSYLIAGSNVTITSASNGAVTISATAGGGGGGSGTNFFLDTAGAGILYTTASSIAFPFGEAGIDAASDKGSNIKFYVSGSKTSGGRPASGVSVFGGDVQVSGTLYLGDGSNYPAINDLTGASIIYKVGTNVVIGQDLALNTNVIKDNNLTTAITLSGPDITVAGNITGSNALVNGSLTTTGNATIGGNISADAEEAKSIFVNNGANNITVGSTTSTTIVNNLVVSGTSNLSGNITLYGNSQTVTHTGTGNLTIASSAGAVLVEGTTFNGNNVLIPGNLTATTGLSGSLTKLADGTSYLIAGSNVTITSASNGAVTISSTGGSSTPAGSDTQVQFNDGGSAFGASANFVFNKSTNTMSVARLFVTGTGNSLTSSGSIRVLDGAQSPVISLSTAGVISGSSLTLGGNAAVNGGSLTTTATTFNLLNTDATTLNIGGAATTVGLGASTGTTTVNNNLVVKGDLFISGTTTTINSTITEFQDAIIGFGFASGSVAQAAGDRGFIGGIAGSNNVAFYWSNALSAFAAATTTSTPSAGSVTVAALQPILASQVQVGNSFNTLTRTGTRLILSGNVVEISGSTVNLTAAGTRVVTMDSTSFDPGATNTFDLGTSSLVWNNLYAKDITVTGRGKFTSEVTSSVSADTNYQISGLDWSAISASNRSKFIDVFVNGSLLLTGSDAGAGSRDYYLGTSNDGVKFTFGLTVDDVVAVVVR